MKKHTEIDNAEVRGVFESYPKLMQEKLLELRQLILQCASEMGVTDICETLKWGEPSYTAKYGSTIRIAWKPATPTNYYLYFNCQTKLIDTFRELYGDELLFQANRAIVLSETDVVAKELLTSCIRLALNYHKLKHLPLLGV